MKQTREKKLEQIALDFIELVEWLQANNLIDGACDPTMSYIKAKKLVKPNKHQLALPA